MLAASVPLVPLMAGLLLAVASVTPAGAQESEPSADTPVSEWFKSLKQPYTGESCCDESDCARAESQWRNGAWWARSNRTGAWFRVPSDVITPETSILPSAVLCECNPWEARSDGSWEPCVLCFVPKPFGF